MGGRIYSAARKNKTESPTLISALQDLCAEKEIEPEVLFKAVEEALKVAYKKNFNQDDDSFEVELNRKNGSFHVYALKIPVDVVSDPKTEISEDEIEENSYEINDDGLARIEVTPKDFGRIAAQAAKQLVVQKLREAERGVIYDEFTKRESDIVKGRVLRVEDNNLIVEAGKTEAVLMPTELSPYDNYKVGDMVRAYIIEVKKGGKGPQVYLSRTHPNFLRRLVEIEIPEIQEGLIEIKSVAREAGSRSKIAVYSKEPNVAAVGACLGQRGTRIKNVLDELGEEKLDVIEWSPNEGVFIANALSPSKIISVALNYSDKSCRVVVPDNQLSLAIGKEGQNARLAAKLTGWKIDIKNLKRANTIPLDEDMQEVDISAAQSLFKVRPKKGKRP
ncbi:MAG: transcription termination/antitermination protein NusA [Selenomonadaceae bacterium]|nr:transcription termination/antitermination protein NusA [Selenomonadaceae bacterium]